MYVEFTAVATIVSVSAMIVNDKIALHTIHILTDTQSLLGTHSCISIGIFNIDIISVFVLIIFVFAY